MSISSTYRFDTYRTGTGSEEILVINPSLPAQVLVIEALLEERNFLRFVTVEMARALGAHGIGAAIPTLPGAGDSNLDTHNAQVTDWRAAVSDAAQHVAEYSKTRPHIASLRGGALLDDAADGQSWWRYAPASGAELLRPLRRAQRVSGPDQTHLAGYRLTDEFIVQLEAATPAPRPDLLRELAADADTVPLWRRAEPACDAGLAAYLASDLADWISSCAGR